jgi:hypothetical protein
MVQLDRFGWIVFGATVSLVLGAIVLPLMLPQQGVPRVHQVC